ncbi:unnamed protein product [Brassica rapa subsp. narinosa]
MSHHRERISAAPERCRAVSAVSPRMCLCPTVVDASPSAQSTAVSTSLVSDCFIYIGLDRVMQFEHD